MIKKWDDSDASRSSIKGTVKAASLTTWQDRRDKHLKGDGDYLVVGDLTIKNTTKEIQFPLSVSEPVSDRNHFRRELDIEGFKD
jgi:polyisoprenoid-binding protein YceI